MEDWLMIFAVVGMITSLVGALYVVSGIYDLFDDVSKLKKRVSKLEDLK